MTLALSRRKLHLGGDKKRRLLSQIQKDCALLEKLEVRLGLGLGLGSGLRVEVRVRVRVMDCALLETLEVVDCSPPNPNPNPN